MLKDVYSNLLMSLYIVMEHSGDLTKHLWCLLQLMKENKKQQSEQCAARLADSRKRMVAEEGINLVSN